MIKKVLKNRPLQSYPVSVSKCVLAHNFSYIIQNKFDLDENEPLGRIQFHINRFTLILVLTQKQKATQR